MTPRLLAKLRDGHIRVLRPPQPYECVIFGVLSAGVVVPLLLAMAGLTDVTAQGYVYRFSMRYALIPGGVTGAHQTQSHRSTSQEMSCPQIAPMKTDGIRIEYLRLSAPSAGGFVKATSV